MSLILPEDLPRPPSKRRFRGLLGPLMRLADWVSTRSRSLVVALGAFLLAALALAAGALAVFAWIAQNVAGGATQRFDESVVGHMRANAHPVWDALAVAGAVLGSGAAMWVVLGVGTVLLWRSRHHFSVLLLWLSFLGGRVLNAELKALFGRPRPDPAAWDMEVFGRAIDFPASFSFPSGHATTGMVVFGTLAYLVARLETSPAARRWTLGGAAALILLIGGSRVYLRVHYPSDVLAGYLAGFAWATMAVVGIEVIGHFALWQPEVAAEEKDVEKGFEPIREAVHGLEDGS